MLLAESLSKAAEMLGLDAMIFESWAQTGSDRHTTTKSLYHL
jgi:hypothetical protein